MEKKVINHFCHEHPLILTENVSEDDCYACGRAVTGSEPAYVCPEQHCPNTIVLHKKCGELPSQISHPKHPQHPIHLVDFHHIILHGCNVCRRGLVKVLGYRCSSCEFDLDINCEKLGIDTLVGEKTLLQHPSHPDHLLTLMRKPGFPFYCDGCGAQDVDMAYLCATCELWFHKSCAELPLVLPVNREYHHHQLVLAFSFPEKYRYHKFRYKCDVCGKDFDLTSWLYFCGDCRFFAHLKCVTSKPHFNSNNEDDDDGCEVIKFPLCVDDVFKELITPFVMRQKGLKKIPDEHDLPRTTSVFDHHNHPLSLVLKESRKVKDEDEDEEEDELKICNMCVTPISSPPYYECASCTYFTHSICNSLPNALATSSSSTPPHLYGDRCPKTHNNYHKFKLCDSLRVPDRWLCHCKLCSHATTGMLYVCEACKRKIDVKCASLPTAIRHASHSHHKSLTMTRISSENNTRWKKCHGCHHALLYDHVAYCCKNEDCDFALDLKCVMLPSSIRKQDWDHHPLLLSFDASRDHPSDFFCNLCEKELHPKKWMYHCRQCDNSSHLGCYKDASGRYRNIKFGSKFVFDHIHPHPLTFTCVSLKKRCDLCHEALYDCCGFECSACYLVVCIHCACTK